MFTVNHHRPDPTTRPSCKPATRPRSATDEEIEELIEEVERLRAAMHTYRSLVNRLLRQQA